MFRKFNLDTEWAVRLISRITNDEDVAIESSAVVKQVRLHLLTCQTLVLFILGSSVCVVLLFACITFQNAASRPSNQRREVLFRDKEKSC